MTDISPAVETQTDIYKLRYLVIPEFLYADDRLSALQLKVAAFIYSYSGDTFYFSNDQLAQMFHCGEWAISMAVKKLIELKYIAVDYKVKAQGGQLRYITRLVPTPKSDLCDRQSQTCANAKVDIIKENNLKENNLKEEERKPPSGVKKEEASLEYLLHLSDDEMLALTEKFKLTTQTIQDEAEVAYNWVKSKGKRYADYRAFLRNWLHKVSLRKPETVATEPKKRFKLENFDKYKDWEDQADFEAQMAMAFFHPDDFRRKYSLEPKAFIQTAPENFDWEYLGLTGRPT